MRDACPKCGSATRKETNDWGYAQMGGGRGSQTWAAELRFCAGANARPACKLMIGVDEPHPEGQHLDVTCWACSHTWAERCKDAKP